MSGQHTQFLDLTNGEGGERAAPLPETNVYLSESVAYDEHDHDVYHNETVAYDEHDHGHVDDEVLAHEEEEEEAYDDDMMDDGGGGSPSPTGSHSHHHHDGPDNRVRIPTAASTGGGGSGSGTLQTGTPGRVVDTGREQTGRWTKEEHEAFLSALQMYGKEWKKVAAKVKTRTVVQTRTHAQKYFQKLQKTMEQTGLDDISYVEMGISSTAKSKKVVEPKKKGRSNSGGGSVGGSIGSVGPSAASPISATKLNRRSSSTTINAAQVISNLSNPATAGSHAISLPLRHGFSTGTTPFSGEFDNDGRAFPTPYSSVGNWLSSATGGSSGGMSGMSGMSSTMKIVAPDPSASMKRGFPEPSPAATGKRKLAEIAAARMLAGVSAGTSSMIAPAAAEDDDGPPTPPPMMDQSEGGSTRLNLKDAPLPPLFNDNVGSAGPLNMERKGLTLQIVNPESLGVSYDHQKRRRGGEQSPVTPWEGQLQALVDGETKADGKPTATAADAVDATSSPRNMNNGRVASFFDGGMGAPMHLVCGPGTSFNRSQLHRAVCDMDLAELRNQLKHLVDLNRLDGLGYCPLHSACAIRLGHPQQESSAEMVELLLSAGANPSVADSKGNTPLHWAARAGDKEVAVKLLLKNCPFDAKNKDNESPLHWSMRSGRGGMDVTTVLLDSGARPGILNKDFRRPIDVAAEGFLDDPNSLVSLRLGDEQGKKVKKELKRALAESSGERKDARTNFLIRSAYSRTLVLHHPECLEHHPKSQTDWETPDRVTSIMRRVLPSSDSTGVTETSGVFPYEITVSKEFDRANLDLLSRVHSTEYLSFVNELSKDLEKQLKDAGEPVEDASFGSPPVVPFTPMVQRSMIKMIDDADVKCGLTSDTSFSVGSLKAARRAAGAVQHAVDCVLVGRNRNAFCVVRPPGHHAGINGLLEGGESCGFCIFNNVAAGALYAIGDDKLLCNRCAIVDIDVHHGNGTEEIVRKCQDPSKLFFFSIHLFDNDKKKRSNNNQFQYKFYPGTGNEDDLALNIINVPIIPLWKEPAPIPQVKNKTHNTRHKTRSSQDKDSQEESLSETGTPRDNGSRTSDGASEVGSAYLSSPPSSSASSGRMAYRQAIQSRLLPALRAFDPDLILISAGFDASRGDVGNARHERGRERMGIDLEPEDYAWTTRKILEIADICCQGRVVSVLEGGYGRTPTTPPVAEPTGLDRTVFAECAVRHLHSLIDPYDTEKRFS